MAQRMNFTDADIVNFLTNVECLEGRFDSMGTLVRGLAYEQIAFARSAERLLQKYHLRSAFTRRPDLQGLDFNDNLTLGGPPSIGYGKANLSPEVLSALTEVAVSEQVCLGPGSAHAVWLPFSRSLTPLLPVFLSALPRTAGLTSSILSPLLLRGIVHLILIIGIEYTVQRFLHQRHLQRAFTVLIHLSSFTTIPTGMFKPSNQKMTRLSRVHSK